MNLREKDIEKIYNKVSPFEFKNNLIELAKEKEKNSEYSILDAGRGNPNWLAVTPREAFFTFGYFAMEESRRSWSIDDLGGMAEKEGIYFRFKKFVKENKSLKSIELLSEIINYAIKEKGFDGEEFLFELVDGIIGDNYPVPDRMLVHCEDIVRDYLLKEMRYDKEKGGNFNVFAVEGATAAMCYIFDSLEANRLLVSGDKIAIMVPVFTPYLEIPLLPRYNFEIIPIVAEEENAEGELWQYPEAEFDKLKDNSIKAVFIVNPGNPSSIAINEKGRNYLKDIVENHNKNLMVISDDVYGTFVDDYKSLMADIPYNTLGVYSFSKYFGVTGWRLGTIALHDNNVFDRLIEELPREHKDTLKVRYGHMTTEPEKLPFLDRVVADSRQVALNHTAGLSTPQQIQMAFFCAFAVLDKENSYKKLTMSICRNRQKLFYEGLGFKFVRSELDAAYYAEFDLLRWAKDHLGEEFAVKLEKEYTPVKILYKLAEESAIVLLGGSGFQGPEWSVRISLANLKDKDYSKIGRALYRTMAAVKEELM
ncbi:MAG: aspartate 4-decarboxylase [Sarcina sp.]